MLNLPAIDYASRVNSLRSLAELKRDDVVYISDMANIRYFSGFTGSAGTLLVSHDSVVLLTSALDEESAQVECSPAGVDIARVNLSSPYITIASLLSGARRLIVDPRQISMYDYWRLSELDADITLVQQEGLPERLRRRKDPAEVARIAEACQIAVTAFNEVVHFLESEPTERAFANRLEARMKELGAENIAFSTIVASGPNSSRPHTRPNSRIIRAGDPVVIDFGAVVDGYHSDVARTVWFGKLDPQIERIYEAAVAAYEAGVTTVRPGVPHAAVDAACRKALTLHGFNEEPLHPSGHSLGLSIHERPYLSVHEEEPILEDFVLAIEPGLYVPSHGGCRMENTVVVRSTAAEVLS